MLVSTLLTRYSYHHHITSFPVQNKCWIKFILGLFRYKYAILDVINIELCTCSSITSYSRCFISQQTAARTVMTLLNTYDSLQRCSSNKKLNANKYLRKSYLFYLYQQLHRLYCCIIFIPYYQF